MTESFLHYIWQFQYFNKEGLTISTGESLQVFQPGIRNTNAGSDFSDARLKIGNLEWRGSVEIHINASGWVDHYHSDDKAYEKVILHVVWEEDKLITRTDGSRMPTLVLKNRVDLSLWDRYKKLFTSATAIPCAAQWGGVASITKLSMVEKALMIRLEAKSALILEMLRMNNGDWEETCYRQLCKNFGFKVNADTMVQLAESLPYKVILKSLDKPYQVESLLFGQAGFLEGEVHGDYPSLLQREYNLLAVKYRLRERKLEEAQWRFLRLRPANFPTVRLAQLAALLTSQQNLFSRLMEVSTIDELVKLLKVKQQVYWQTHYHLKGEQAKVPSIGKASVYNIIINTVVPLLVAYGKLQDNQLYIDRAVSLLQHLPAEENRITREWYALEYNGKTAFDSQGLIELYNNFCVKRKCLECTIGSSLVSRG